MRQKLQSSRKLDGYQILLLTVVILLEHLLMSSDSFSPSRQIMLSILVEIVAAAPMALCPEKDSNRLILFLRRLNGLSNLAKEGKQALIRSSMGRLSCQISSDQQKPSRAIMALDALGPQVPAA